MTEERKLELDNNCLQLRSDLIDLLHSIQTGHPGGSLVQRFWPPCTMKS